MTIKLNMRSVVILTVLFFILLYFRRGYQLLYPDVWQEDYYNIISFIQNGWMNLFEPVAGYLITVPKLITNISMSISFIYYPEISTYLTWIFTIFVALAVVYSPTHLKYPLVASILIFFIPTDAENFGLPLYTFWFSAILLFLVALWKSNEKQILKNIFLLVGGASSPVVALMVPIQMFRSIVLENKKEELISLSVAVVLSIVQVSYILNTGTHTNTPIINIDFLNAIIIKFFAFYYLRDVVSSEIVLLLGGIYILILFAIYWFYNKKDIYFYILLFLLFASIGLSVARLDPNIIHPILAGPRYFFFPFILLSWTLLYICSKNKYYAIGILPILALSVFISLKSYGREHDYLEWRNHIYACSKQSENYRIPVHFNGDEALAWNISLSSEKCQELLANDFFQLSESDKKIFSITVSGYSSLDVKKVLNVENIVTTSYVKNQTFDKKTLNGFETYGSFINGDSDTASIQFTSTNSSQVLFKTGPKTKNQTIKIINNHGEELMEKTLDRSESWSVYTFHKNLPETFIVEINDDGTGWGEWSAVAFKKDDNDTTK